MTIQSPSGENETYGASAEGKLIAAGDDGSLGSR